MSVRRFNLMLAPTRFLAPLLIAAALMLGACSSGSGSGFGGNFPLIEKKIQLRGAPAILIQLSKGDEAKLAGVNRDHFFPNNCWRVLVSEEAYKAGLFQDVGHAVESVAPISPDKHWTSQLRWVKHNGEEIECLEFRSTDTLRTVWPLGSFRSGVWAPDSAAIAIADMRIPRMPAALVYWPPDGALKELNIYNSEAGAFFAKSDVRPINGILSIRRWITNTLVILWYRSSGSDDGAPPWGYEILVDASRENYGSRVLRAYIGY
jgi:hypothetical protein